MENYPFAGGVSTIGLPSAPCVAAEKTAVEGAVVVAMVPFGTQYLHQLGLSLPSRSRAALLDMAP
jgi:hypothetical protein